MAKKILVLDDEQVIRNLCRRLLAKRQCDLRFAGTVEEALSSIAAEPVDLLITDLKLPDGDGTEVIRRVHERFPETKILVMTGSLSPDQRIDQIKDWNVVDIIFKPFDIQDFEAVLEKALA